MFNWIFIFQRVVLMFIYVKQHVNLAWQLCWDLKNWKIKKENVKNQGKKCFAVRMEWVKIMNRAGHLRYFWNRLQGIGLKEIGVSIFKKLKIPQVPSSDNETVLWQQQLKVWSEVLRMLHGFVRTARICDACERDMSGERMGWWGLQTTAQMQQFSPMSNRPGAYKKKLES